MQIVVETASGKLRGEGRGDVVRFRGVPYARAPVGTLRFRPPEPAEPWAGVRDALRIGPSAPQGAALSGPLGRFVGGGPRRSEDCLTLNLWTPGTDDARRPVLVWIHGGAFVLGSGAMPLYSGRRLAERGDVVVVTLNYRLGALGFLHLDLVQGTEGASNLGIRDQVAALRWVRENATAFGGDPENVTVFGESAGAMSVGTLLGVPEARPLFHRAILQSGAMHNVSSAEKGARTTEIFLREAGLGPDASRDALAALPAERVLAAQMATSRQLGIGHGTLPWQPVVDGAWIPRQPLEQVAAGETAGIPVLVGTNRDEWKLFTILDRRSRGLDEDGLRRRLERVVPGKDADGVAWAERALSVYRAGRPGIRVVELWEAIQADRIFRVPATRLAEIHARHEPRTFSYLFQWRPRAAPKRVGACHALEIPFVFGTVAHPWVRALLGRSVATRSLARGIQEAWLSFARDGEPASLELPEWPRYDAERRATLVLGRSPRAELAPFEPERALWAPHLSG